MAITASQLVAKIAVEGDAAAKQKLTSMGSATDQASEKMKGGLFGALKSTGSGLLDFGAKLGMGVIGLGGIASAAIDFGSALIAPNAEMEQTRVSFAAFIPNAKELTQTLADLKKFSATTPFEAPEVNQAALSLLNMNVAAKDTTTWIANLGAAVSKVGGNGVVLDDVAAIISQMGVKGKVTTEEMMQLSERNIPAFQILAQAMNVPVSNLQDMISKGQLGRDKIELLVKSMGKFGGSAMIEQGKTFNGLLGTVKDNATQALAAFTGPLFDMAKQGLSTLGDLVSSPQFQDFAKLLGEQVGGALQQIGTVISQTVGPAFADLGPLIGQIGAYLQGDDFAGFVADVQTVGNQIDRLLRPAFEALQPQLPSLKDMLTTLGNILTTVVVPAIDNVVFPLGQFLLNINESRGAIQAGLMPVLNQVWSALQQVGAFLVSTFTPVWSQLVQVWQTQLVPALQPIVPAFMQMWTALQPLMPVLQQLGQFVAGVLVVSLVLLVGVLAGVVQGIAGLISGLAVVIGGVVQVISGVFQIFAGSVALVVDLVTGKFDKLGADVTTIFNGLGTMFTGFWNIVQGSFQAGVGFVTGLVSGFYTTVVSIFTNLYNTLVGHSIIPDMVNGIVQWIGTLPAKAMAFITTLLTQAIAAFTLLASNATKLATQLVTNFIAQIQQLPSKAVSALSSLASKLGDVMSGVANQATQWGKNVINNIISGINSMASSVSSAASNIASQIKNNLGFSSPTKEGPGSTADKWGPAFVRMFAGDLQAGVPMIRASVSNLIQPIAAVGQIGSIIPPGASAIPASLSASPTVVVNVPPSVIEMDGQRLTSGLMPLIVAAIRRETGGRI